jgi:hypothetical protein
MEHDLITQQRVQRLGRKLIEDYAFERWRIPRASESFEKNFEWTEPEVMYDEFEDLWLLFWKYGFALRNFELYPQSNGTFVLTNFSEFGFRMTSGPVSIRLPDPSQMPSDFFEADCFPSDFLSHLRAKGFEVPTDCLPTTKTDTD